MFLFIFISFAAFLYSYFRFLEINNFQFRSIFFFTDQFKIDFPSKKQDSRGLGYSFLGAYMAPEPWNSRKSAMESSYLGAFGPPNPWSIRNNVRIHFFHFAEGAPKTLQKISRMPDLEHFA